MAAFGEIRGAGGDIADMLMDADMKFDDIKNPEDPEHPLPLTHANYISYQESKNRAIRKGAFDNLYKAYGELNNTFGATYLNTLKESTLMANMRHYESARAESLSGYNIPESVYDNLVSTVHDFLPEMYRYLRLRKKLLVLLREILCRRFWLRLRLFDNWSGFFLFWWLRLWFWLGCRS